MLRGMPTNQQHIQTLLNKTKKNNNNLEVRGKCSILTCSKVETWH